jgi:hypothetical protein
MATMCVQIHGDVLHDMINRDADEDGGDYRQYDETQYDEA